MTPRYSERHAFISYVHEDADAVDRIQQNLEAARVRVWRDIDQLWPGEDWKLKIRNAITDDSLVFVACFSDNSVRKAKSFQREELVLAIEEFRLRNPDPPWLIPVRLSDCALPQYDLGAGRTLDSLHRVDLFGDRAATGVSRLIGGVLRVMASLEQEGGSEPPPAPLADADPGAFIKKILLDPARQIELDDYVMDRANDAAEACADQDLFPTTSPQLTNGPDGLRYIVEQTNRYWTAIEPLLSALIPGCAWGQLPQHNVTWARAIERVVNVPKPQGGQTALVELQRYPILPLLYGSALAALLRENYPCLKTVAIDARFRDSEGHRIPLIGAANVWSPFGGSELAAQVLALDTDGESTADDVVRDLMSGRQGKRYTPVSDHLHTRLRPLFSGLAPDDHDYTSTFDRLEVLLGALAVDAKADAPPRTYINHTWFGSFTWRDKFSDPPLEQLMLREITQSGPEHPLLASGLFSGSLDRAESAFQSFEDQAARARPYRF